MSSNESVIARSETFRARIEWDELGQEEAPDHDGQGHVFSTWRDRLERQHSDYGREYEGQDLAYALRRALDRYGPLDWTLIERYLRTWHDVADFDRISTQDGEYVFAVTREQVEEEQWGKGDDGRYLSLETWRAWLDGEVYYWAVDELVTYARADDAEQTFEQWEVRDSVHGFYGDVEYVRTEALAALRELAEEHGETVEEV